jgi:anti-sigma B factor antagonist
MLTVSTHPRGDAVYLHLVGRLDGSPCCESLATELKSTLKAGHRRVVLDLSELQWVSSCGIGCLVAGFVSVKRAGGSMVLLSPNDRVLHTLTTADLVPTVFEVIETDVHARSHSA